MKTSNKTLLRVTVLGIIMCIVFKTFENLKVFKIVDFDSRVNGTAHILKDLEEITPINRNNYSFVLDFEQIDWVDYKFVAYEANRTGPGEQGKGVTLTDPEDIKKNEEIAKIEGLNAYISDKISVNRSVIDTRPKKCKGKTFLKHLPSVSIIMIFHNEYQSILYRSLHSVYNRTPHKLLHEIILVNDKSTRDYLYEPLENYVKENFHGKVKIIVLPERSGLIRARMEGAKVATGEILVFMDAHIEANVNWLPPLIEPIAIDPLTSTTPVIDYFWKDNFEYQGREPTRGNFDWSFNYKWMPMKKGYIPEENFEYPIMLGCVFAINRQYYWDLGAYDEELMIWNGENYELSFKLWLCGGRLLQVPCSRVAHTFRVHNEYRKKEGVDFEGRNFKRIAEVWLDDYKEYLYKSNPDRYAKIDPGDLTKPKMIREKLKCKPFKYYLEYVAKEMLEIYHPYPISDFASGAIISIADSNLCVDTLSRPIGEPLSLYPCHENKTNPKNTQNFHLTWNRNIRNDNNYDHCVDIYNVGLAGCHYAKSGNQFWRYFSDTNRLVPGNNDNFNCLTANLEDRLLSIQKCESDNIRQKWDWGFVNQTALKNWCIYGSEMEGDCY